MTDTYRLNEYQIEFATGLLKKSPSDTGVRLEPKAADVLLALIEAEGEVVSKEQLLRSVWNSVIVSDDALLRVISQLRKSLGDNAKSPRFIKTVPKRGYQLVCVVQKLAKEKDSTNPPLERSTVVHASKQPNRFFKPAILIVAIFLISSLGLYLAYPNNGGLAHSARDEQVARADNFYHQMRRNDNEMAINLYEQSLSRHADNSDALAGLANALVQRLLRWSEQSPKAPDDDLETALRQGTFESAAARTTLQRARSLAEHAVELSPDSYKAHKALGFVLHASGELEQAETEYLRAIELNPSAWPVYINLGDLYDFKGEPEQALTFFERAFEAMDDSYDAQIAQVRPWYADVGYLIGERHYQLNDHVEAELWFRRVLSHSPLHKDATLGLIRLLVDSGETEQAKQLCFELNRRTEAAENCDQLTER
ncbi:MAG: DUF2225 domain-containing protein [Gammaproteobacteria bacterium]|nr:DUF2225 domain-containing protein [Gammaproteobacteria bacterium]